MDAADALVGMFTASLAAKSAAHTGKVACDKKRSTGRHRR